MFTYIRIYIHRHQRRGMVTSVARIVVVGVESKTGTASNWKSRFRLPTSGVASSNYSIMLITPRLVQKAQKPSIETLWILHFFLSDPLFHDKCERSGGAS
jgi:hypothetical protein